MWPGHEQDTRARAAAKRVREVIAVTDRVTGKVTIRQGGADSTAVRSGAEAMSVYEGEEKTEPCRVDIRSQRIGEQGRDDVGAGQEELDQ